MQEHIIRKDDGSELIWNKAKNGNYYCLLYNDNKRKYTFSPTTNLTCELFMIGGGGAGGYFFGGGGGAGAAYINKNYTFEKNRTYNFEIGTGGKCDIKDIDKLFKSGLVLNIYNNTTPKLTNISFSNDDYLSLGIQNSGMIQSFIVNNITIPSTIFLKNTTYIWDGYIKTDKTGFANIAINSSIKIIIWFDKYIYTNENALIDNSMISDVKIIQLESNRFYNIKIIAYNDNVVNNNFNITFENCKFFNFDKNNEIYNYDDKATDSILTYRNSDNSFETIRCRGGGFGGCGYYNQNNNLDGGCGGGSGINKLNGKSVIQAIYNGYDGAIGEYCGGGGGIMSAGTNNEGGDGKILNWFDENLIFGAGGNAANLKQVRQLGYGCGGNGGECCYYSKLLINNNGNNGCILLYINTSPAVIEHFADKIYNMLPETTIPNVLIKSSFNIYPDETLLRFYAQDRCINAAVASGTGLTNENLSRYKYFNNHNAIFNRLSLHQQIRIPIIACVATQTAPNIEKDDDTIESSHVYKAQTSKITEAYNLNGGFAMENYIYDVITISNLLATVYRILWYEFNITNNLNISTFSSFISTLGIEISTGDTSGIKGYNILLASNWNNAVHHLNLGINIASNTAYSIDIGITSGTITVPVFLKLNSVSQIYHNKLKYLNNKIGETFNNANIDIVPNYHSNNQTTINSDKEYCGFATTKKMYADIFAEKKYVPVTLATKISSPATVADYYILPSSGIDNISDSIAKTAIKTYQIKILNDNSIITRANLEKLYKELIVISPPLYSNAWTAQTATASDTSTLYNNQRIYLYLEIFNIILNTEPTTILSILKHWMHYYNMVYYNVLIQYALFMIQNNRAGKTINTTVTGTDVTDNVSDIAAAELSETVYYTNIINDINLIIANMNNIIANFSSNSITKNAITDINDNVNNLNATGKDFYASQKKLNKSINEYNKQLESYNIIVSQYKIIVIISIIIAIIIIIVFGSSIDVNTKISAYIIIIITIIIALILYRNNAIISEPFMIAHAPLSDRATVVAIPSAESDDTFKNKINEYKKTLNKYYDKLQTNLASLNIASIQTPINEYSRQMATVRIDKVKFYNLKSIKLDNSIEILKKSIDFYYYIIILITLSIVLFTIALILYLINPGMILQIAVLCVIPFIILVYYVSYNIHKSTRLAENKNYWANYNPSDETIKNL
jgi:hypothetical protein